MSYFIVFVIIFTSFGCTEPSSKHIKTLIVESFNCFGPKPDILVSEEGYCKFITAIGEKCTYFGLVIKKEQVKVCLVTTRIGYHFYKDCQTDNIIYCE